MWSRSLWEWCSDLVSDPAIVSQFRWNAERVYKYDSIQDKFERCISEPWTADSWWKAQVCINILKLLATEIILILKLLG